MDMSSTRWISEMGIDDVSFMDQWDMGSLDQFILQPYDQQETLQCPPPLMNTMSNTLSYSSMALEKPKKMPRTGSWSSTQAQPPDASPTSILSFGSSDSPVNHSNMYEEFLIEDVKPKDLRFLIPKGSKRSHEIMVEQGVKKTVAGARPPSYQDHIIAERKRREKLSQRFIALSAMIPNLKKMDKASVLGDAIRYVKQLQENVKTLEEQVVMKKVESAVLGQTNPNGDDNSSQVNPNIEVKQTEKTILIKIQCENRKGMITKALFEIENLNLSITNTSSMSFPSSSLDITVLANIEEGFSMTVEEVVKKLSIAL
ncbi:transcription factor bHLH25-like [Dioscorea cayenensis subsp. rotundata]|uniref:Transcription factor bHLH25-like n=1 Tax=Dioscorea cayennensis subsp. rotundata TaxID=55577 RepID=A0AB40CRD9_DIOCR|nr:transcription factor bHLH25-like [Dioscorea cayenensis subsp. rotundata]XP_039141117.1 transcription factor bHLH25-like [Dioscorea cayenensis subsp. rotundata]